MATRSKFEAQLSPGLREIAYSVKIPDCNRSLKPFDYVLAMVKNGVLRYVAVEAKKADGWGLGRSKWEPHQRRSLQKLSLLDKNSAWVAIGFLDLPKMKRGPNLRKLEKQYKKDAYLIRWVDFLDIETETTCKYEDVARYSSCRLKWCKRGKRYHWVIPKTHKILF